MKPIRAKESEIHKHDPSTSPRPLQSSGWVTSLSEMYPISIQPWRHIHWNIVQGTTVPEIPERKLVLKLLYLHMQKTDISIKRSTRNISYTRTHFWGSHEPQFRKICQYIRIHVDHPFIPECVGTTILTLRPREVVLDEFSRVYRMHGIGLCELKSNTSAECNNVYKKERRQTSVLRVFSAVSGSSDGSS